MKLIFHLLFFKRSFSSILINTKTNARWIIILCSQLIFSVCALVPFSPFLCLSRQTTPTNNTKFPLDGFVTFVLKSSSSPQIYIICMYDISLSDFFSYVIIWYTHKCNNLLSRRRDFIQNMLRINISH